MPSSRISIVKDEEIQLESLFVIMPVFQSCLSTEIYSLVSMGKILATLNWRKWGYGMNNKSVTGYITLKQHEYKIV